MRESWVSLDGASIYVETVGEGRAALVMPVAWGMSHDFYQTLLGVLELGLQLIHFDTEGTGMSSDLPAGWNPARIVDEAEAVRAAGEYARVIVLGHASGAFLAMAYALDHPDHVEALILISPFASYTRANDMSVSRLESAPHWDAFQKRVAEIRKAALTPEDRFRAIFKEQRAVDLVDYGPHYFLMADAADEATFNPQMNEDGEIDFIDELETIEVPVLIISGVQDPLTPIEESRLIAAELPYVRLVELQASGHYPFVEQPDEFAAAISQFMRDIEPQDEE
ncbi:MAG TPA: alpha/beta hydrolase [Chloroflexota bacterium]|jgi:pimeloyl-ACP methyl ester carboxylesterase|nr:alpha/beta hydrolase [Chloroflexota bacterium]